MRIFHLFIYSILVSSSFFCSKGAPSVVPADTIDPYTGTTTGYNYPVLLSVEPLNGSTNVPTNACVTFRFSMPVNSGTLVNPNLTVVSGTFGALTAGTDYTLTVNSPTTIGNITFLYNVAHAGTTALSPLAAGDLITVTFNAGITDSVNSIALSNPGSYSFTTGTAPDQTAPSIVIASCNPLNGAINVALNSTISIRFNEPVDQTSLNSATFYLMDSLSNIVPCSRTYTVATNTAVLTPLALLDDSMTYSVYLTIGVHDLSGNALPATTRTFSTVVTPVDPIVGNPSFLLPLPNPAYTDISATSAYISWCVSEPVNYTLYYGRGDNVTFLSSLADPDTAHLYSEESRALSPPLLAGKRYYALIRAVDNAGNTTDSTVTEFNTQTGEIPTLVAGGAQNQNSVRIIPAPVANTGLFMLWSDYQGYLYGQRYTDALATTWASSGIFTGSSITFGGAQGDELGNLVVTVVNGGNLYSKRLGSTGTFFNWGAGTTADTDPGYQVTASGLCSLAQSVPVYGGIVLSEPYNGVTEGINIIGTPLFCNTVDFSAGPNPVITGDYIVKNLSTSQAGVQVTRQTFNYMLDIDAGLTFASPEGFIVTRSPQTITSSDHSIRTTPTGAVIMNYACDGNTISYTDHSTILFTLGTGDVISYGTDFARISGLTTITPNGTSYITGTNESTGATLTDTTVLNKFSPVSAGEIAYSVPDNSYAFITVPGANTLTLGIGIFSGASQGYRIYHNEYCNTHFSTYPFSPFYRITADWNIGIPSAASITLYDSNKTGSAQTPPTYPLYDNDLTAVITDDYNIALNFSDDRTSRILQTGSFSHALNLAIDALFGNNVNKTYRVMRIVNPPTSDADLVSKVRTIGTAEASAPGTLVDSSQTFTATVQAGDIVYNVSATINKYSMVTAVNSNSNLTLSYDQTINPGDYYVILRERGVLHVWREGVNIRKSVISMDRNPPVTLSAAATITAGNYPNLISDGRGRGILVYLDTTLNRIRACRIDASGTVSNVLTVSTSSDANSQILKVISDTQGGVIVLFSYNGANRYLAVQWIRRNPATDVLDYEWGAAGVPVVTAVTSPSMTNSEDIVFNYNGTISSPAYITYETGGNIFAARVASSLRTWGPVTVSNEANTQCMPKVIVDNADNYAYIVWVDNRFYLRIGYGVFAQRLTVGTGAPSWSASTSGTVDNNGCAIILNRYTNSWPISNIVKYNSGTQSIIFWEDSRNGAGTDILTNAAFELMTFAP